jgi:hypothetical protein
LYSKLLLESLGEPNLVDEIKPKHAWTKIAGSEFGEELEGKVLLTSFIYRDSLSFILHSQNRLSSIPQFPNLFVLGRSLVSTMVLRDVAVGPA